MYSQEQAEKIKKVLKVSYPKYVDNLFDTISGFDVELEFSQVQGSLFVVSGDLKICVFKGQPFFRASMVDKPSFFLTKEQRDSFCNNHYCEFNPFLVKTYLLLYGKDARKLSDFGQEEIVTLLKGFSVSSSKDSLAFFDLVQKLNLFSGGADLIKALFPNVPWQKCFFTKYFINTSQAATVKVYDTAGRSTSRIILDVFDRNLLSDDFVFLPDFIGYTSVKQPFIFIPENLQELRGEESICPTFPGNATEYNKKMSYDSVTYYVPVWYFKKYYHKAECGHWSYGAESDSTVLCHDCKKGISPTGRIINGYSERAPRILGFIDKKQLVSAKPNPKTIYFGAEIELENGGENEAIQLYKNLRNYMLVKSDGSLRNGFEIITAPAEYENHKEKAKELFAILNEKTKMKSQSNCGLHFHVSRSALTMLQIGKQLEFIYNPANKDFIVKVAGRISNDYANLNREKRITDVAPENFSFSNQNRYDAINLANIETIEYRIFASTTDYNVFMYRLDFVRSLIDYTKPCAVTLKNLKDIKNLDVYLSFLEQNKREYSFLASFLSLNKKIPEKYISISQQKKGIR